LSIDEVKIYDHLEELARWTVEESLNAILDAKAYILFSTQRYEHQFHTKAGEVTLKIHKLHKQTIETAIIERYRRR
jgi:transposase-like protein